MLTYLSNANSYVHIPILDSKYTSYKFNCRDYARFISTIFSDTFIYGIGQRFEPGDIIYIVRVVKISIYGPTNKHTAASHQIMVMCSFYSLPKIIFRLEHRNVVAYVVYFQLYPRPSHVDSLAKCLHKVALAHVIRVSLVARYPICAHAHTTPGLLCRHMTLLAANGT